MLSTKDRNSINENPGIKASFLSSKTSDIFDDANNYSGCSFSGVNNFRASDRSSYTATVIDTFGTRTDKYNYVLKSNENNKDTTQAIAAAIQPNLIAGSYYLVYQADGYNYVAESNESNNAVAGVINITKPDLIVQNISNPSSAAAGSTIQLNYQIKNQGNTSAVASNTKFYLSQDLNVGNEDVYLGYDKSKIKFL